MPEQPFEQSNIQYAYRNISTFFNHYLPACSLAHLLEKHYCKFARHPGCNKFTIDVPNIVYWIKEAGCTEPQSISSSLNFKRCMDTGTVTGYNREGESTTFITVITDAGGTIKTAFPGLYSH